MSSTRDEREEDAWDAAQTFMNQFNVDERRKPSFMGRDTYFGSDLFTPSPTILSISLPPPASSPSSPNVPVVVTIRVRIPDTMNNRLDNLHGGAAATIFDNLNSVALAVWAASCAPSEEMAMRWIQTGVSRTLNVSYLRPVKVGEWVDVENEVVSVGKTIALVRGRMLEPKTGKVITVSEHHKVSTYQEPKL